MKNSIYLILLMLTIVFFSCNTTQSTSLKKDENQAAKTINDTVKITNKDLEYEIYIIDPGFSRWLNTTAQPEGFYSQKFMENRNNIYVFEYNQRVINPQRYNSSLYELQIDYQPGINYGYEVNYKLYNYFIYFQIKYNQRLGPFFPRI